jgi:hypothetical protein
MLDDGRRTTDDGPTAAPGGPGIEQAAELAGNRPLGLMGFCLWVGGVTTVGVNVGAGLSSTWRDWWLVWGCALAAIGLLLLLMNRKGFSFPKGGGVLGLVIACIGAGLSGGFVPQLVNPSLGRPVPGVVFLIGGIVLFTVGMLIALDKNRKDVSRRRGGNKQTRSP